MSTRIDRRMFLAAGAAVLCERAMRAEERFVSAQSPQILDLNGLANADRLEKPPVVSSVAWMPGALRLATAGDDHHVRIWNHADGKLLQTLRGHQDWVRSVVFMPDASQLISAGDDHRILNWDLSVGQPRALQPRQAHVVYSLALSGDGQLLAAAGFSETVQVYETGSGREVWRFSGPSGDQRSVVFSPDGRHLAAAGRNGQIRVWSMANGQARLEIAAGSQRIRALAWSPDGGTLAAAGDLREISLWNAADGANLGRLSCPGKVMALEFCGPTRLASAGTDNLVRMWDIGRTDPSYQLSGHTGTIAALDYDPQADVLVSAGYDTTVRVWPLKPEVAAEARNHAAAAGRQQ